MNAVSRPTPRALITAALRDAGFQVIEGPVSRVNIGATRDQVYIVGGAVITPETALRVVARRLERLDLEYVPPSRADAREGAFFKAVRALSRVDEFSTGSWMELSKYSGDNGVARPVLPATAIVEV